MNLSHTIAILAYNNHELTKRNLHHLKNLGYGENILLFDNGSKPSFESIAKNLGIRYQRETSNCYVNPAWNKIFDQENCDFLTLLNNDCFILSVDYFKEILHHMYTNNIGISSCKTKNILRLNNNRFEKGDYFYFSTENHPLAFNSQARRQGWLMTLNLKTYQTLDYKIPDYLKLWYGDDWIWGQFIRNKIKTAVYKNRYAVHIKSSTISSVAMQRIIEEDNKNLIKFGEWHRQLSPLLHKRTRLFSRYV